MNCIRCAAPLDLSKPFCRGCGAPVDADGNGMPDAVEKLVVQRATIARSPRTDPLRPLDPKPSLEQMLLRYLAAYGPASARDAQVWCGLTAIPRITSRPRAPDFGAGPTPRHSRGG